ncbi:ATP-binding protein [Burkholderia cepacia]|uniref:ATP-binding protein n=1 Tax=Burkholderia cepacia TaxID=292 RepID=UPI000F5E478A|nr:ATP-binding protein [Burkholderia cepacia]RRA24955.1 ATP-binding protein [Burkholderia cepacia]
MSITTSPNEAQFVVDAFKRALDGVTPDFHIKTRPDGDFLVFEFSNPATRFYELLNEINDELPEDHPFRNRSSIATRNKKPANALVTPEALMLQRELSSTLTVDKNTFGNDFISRYTESVTALETNIVLQANHAVYGRRGSGKSSLLAYAMHQLRHKNLPYAWVAMQTYASRNDKQAIASVLANVLREVAQYAPVETDFTSVADELETLSESDDENSVHSRLTRITPRVRRMIGGIATAARPLTIFLDDIHVLGTELQPELLAFLYSLTRGNCTHIKLSGIEQLTNLWDSTSKRGLESPHDVQTLILDHNLTNPDQSKEHIVSILDRHAVFCGLPGIRYIADDNYLDRLVLSAAAVPRDAMSLFSKSITRSLTKKQKTVSILSLNAAASEAIEEKLKDVEKDISSDDKKAISACLERVKAFCLSDQKTNAFLVKIQNSSPGYANVQRLIALRFVHLLHEGITPHKAGERYVALMLDYGFYIGIRAAKSITLFPDKPRSLTAKELRTLPIFIAD